MKLPHSYQLLHKKALNAIDKKNLDLAKKYLLQIYLKYPNHPTLIENISKICIELNQFEDAHIFLLRSLNRNPNDYIILTTCGYVQLKIGLLSEAEKNIRNAINIYPERIEAYHSLTAILIAKEDFNGALQVSLESLKIDPFSTKSLNNLGASLTKLNQLDEAKSCFETSLTISSNYNFLALYNLGSIEYKLNNIQSSIKRFEEIIKNSSKYTLEELIQTKTAISYSYLNNGDISKGWDYYKYGFNVANPIQNRRSPDRNFNKPQWNYEPLNGKTLLIWCEQGLGDEFLFLSILPNLPFDNESIIIECDNRIVNILSLNFPKIKFRASSYKNDFIKSSVFDDFDLQIPIGNLMSLYRSNINDFPKITNYLQPNQTLKSHYKSKLCSHSNKLKIGICWRSGKLNTERNVDYTNLIEWRPIFELATNFDFVNLQYGECEDEIIEVEKIFNINIIRWPELDLKNDLDSIIALIATLDCVITIGSAVSHIAGAIGTKQLLLTPRSWVHLGQNYHPFFNCIKLLIPDNGKRVSDVLEQAATELKKMSKL
jgi:tetratricopeptide (TPR) repeat protein